jgi:hypothetical protein
MESISIDALPQTLRDAVFITRELGIQFLWIDAICIVQDDEEDWIREARIMGHIYQNSIITIAATGASDSSQGCFIPRPPRTSDSISLPYRQQPGSDLIEGAFTLLPSWDDFSASVLQSTWNTRGWILQERLLARRIVHFAHGQTFWECRTQSRGEDGRPLLLETKRSLTDFQRGADSGRGWGWDWCRLVEDYTRRRLTKSQDKLIALAGLAGLRQQQQRQRGGAAASDEYHYGLWASSFSTGLLWYNAGQAPRYAVPVAPSWSWASVDGAVKWESWIIDAAPVATYRVSASALNLSTRIKPVTRGRPVREDNKLEYRVTSGLIYDNRAMAIASALVGAGCGQDVGWAAFDEQEGAQGLAPALFFAAWISENKAAEDDEGRDTYNVLIIQFAESHGCYKRVGVGEIVAENWFKDQDVESIDIC